MFKIKVLLKVRILCTIPYFIINQILFWWCNVRILLSFRKSGFFLTSLLIFSCIGQAPLITTFNGQHGDHESEIIMPCFLLKFYPWISSFIWRSAKLTMPFVFLNPSFISYTYEKIIPLFSYKPQASNNLCSQKYFQVAFLCN